MKLVVDKSNALGLLVSNKHKHIAEYELQLEAWKKAYMEYTNDLNDWSQSQPTDGDATMRPLEPSKPRYHVEHYDKLIRKLEVHTEKTIELGDSYGDNEYDKIFENQFDWSHGFTTLSANYISTGHIAANSLKTARGI